MGVGGTATREGEWLDLVADLVARPLTTWPVDRVLPLLARSFDAPAGAYHGQEACGPVERRPWPPDFYDDRLADVQCWSRLHAATDHPLLRYYLATGRAEVMQVADVPDRVADHRVQQRWRAVCDDLLGSDVVSQVSLPVCLDERTHRAFLVGRADEYSPQEMGLLRRVQRVLVGLDRQISAHARWAARTGALAAPTAEQVGLTPRESVVLDMLATGATARAIARRLTVGERTVQKHLQRVYAKLGVADRLAAVQRAQLLGLLPPPALGSATYRSSIASS
ncbi:helix-turn-helix transcriptional regulator [Actinomycetospora lemnae]|uniref:LuxR C-terminal-related transcriptional regulator n=1 Tax=Actinomycetospora lemnae TaxID=3019891 RepID=A0ABT5SSI4_9PSEU|nr:LuxR C-terminal-related transcriptional regulator [Actinomycetospora sp. DW7H6]MDD7964997.1 LuxR C-terminal-related transcriptional regulator [Actinomycetospora sp. DW7H6]